MKKLIVIIIALVVTTTGCASITNDAMTPIAISFSDGSDGKCILQNKRGVWQVDLPATVLVRRSDDALKYDSQTEDGRRVVGTIPSKIGGKLYASILFLDLGIVDKITDKHREYTASFVIPVKKVTSSESGEESDAISGNSVNNKNNNSLVYTDDLSNTYHKLDCPELSTENRIAFPSSQQAEDAGDVPCEICKSRRSYSRVLVKGVLQK